MATITRANLRIELARQTGSLLASATADSASYANVLVDADVLTSQYLDPMAYAPAWIILTSGSASGDIRRVNLYGPEQGALFPDQDFSAAPGAATYEVHKYDPDLLNRCINHALSHRWYPFQLLLTRLTDGDMETSGVTNWTDSNATSSKITTAANIWRGTQSLRVLNSAASGYSRTPSIDVQTSSTMYVAALCRNEVGTARLQAYNVTNPAVIDAVTSAERDWKMLHFTFDTGTARQVQIRLVGDGSTADIYWDDLVLVGIHDTRFTLPSLVTEKFQVRKIKGFRGRASLGNNVLDGRSLQTFDWGNADMEFDQTAANPFTLELQGWHGGSHMLWADIRRSFPELTTDDATTVARDDWIVAWAAAELYTRLAQSTIEQATKNIYDREMARWTSIASQYERAYSPREHSIALRVF